MLDFCALGFWNPQEGNEESSKVHEDGERNDRLRLDLIPQAFSQVMEELCSICGEEISLKQSIPCSHAFCYLCIRRHLSRKDFCPVCHEGPYTICDLLTPYKPNGSVSKISRFYRGNERSPYWEPMRCIIPRVRDTRSSDLVISLDTERMGDIMEPFDSIMEDIEQRKGLQGAAFRGKDEEEKVIEKLCKLKEYMRRMRRDMR